MTDFPNCLSRFLGESPSKMKRKSKPNILHYLKKRSQGFNSNNYRYYGGEVMRLLLISSESNFKSFTPFPVNVRDNIQSCDNDFLLVERRLIQEYISLTVKKVVNIGSKIVVQEMKPITISRYGARSEVSHEVHTENRHCDHSEYVFRNCGYEPIEIKEIQRNMSAYSNGFFIRKSRGHVGNDFKPYGLILADSHLIQYDVVTKKLIYEELLPRSLGLRYSEFELDRAKFRAIVRSTKIGNAAKINLERVFIVFSTRPMKKLIILTARINNFPEKYVNSYGTPTDFNVSGDIFFVTTTKKYLLVYDFEKILEENLRGRRNDYHIDYNQNFLFAVRTHHNFLSLSHFNALVKDMDCRFRLRDLWDVVSHEEDDSDCRKATIFGSSVTEETFVGFLFDESFRIIETAGDSLSIFHAKFDEKDGKIVSWKKEFEVNPRLEERSLTTYKTRTGRLITINDSYIEATSTRNELVAVDYCADLKLIVVLIYTKTLSSEYPGLHIMFHKILMYDLYSYELLKKVSSKDFIRAGLDTENAVDNKDVRITISYDMLVIYTGVRYVFLVLNGLSE